VQRVIKSVLPESAQIGKDAKAAFARSAGIFILYLTACANDFCKDAKRQTISAQDVMMVRSACIFNVFMILVNSFKIITRSIASALDAPRASRGDVLSLHSPSFCFHIQSEAMQNFSS
jgi:histone H3/H4